LHQSLAAALQLLAFLKLVNEFPRLGRHLDQDFLYAGGANALTMLLRADGGGSL
jgi:hypothetical protein